MAAMGVTMEELLPSDYSKSCHDIKMGDIVKKMIGKGLAGAIEKDKADHQKCFDSGDVASDDCKTFALTIQMMFGVEGYGDFGVAAGEKDPEKIFDQVVKFLKEEEDVGAKFPNV